MLPGLIKKVILNSRKVFSWFFARAFVRKMCSCVDENVIKAQNFTLKMLIEAKKIRWSMFIKILLVTSVNELGK